MTRIREDSFGPRTLASVAQSLLGSSPTLQTQETLKLTHLLHRAPSAEHLKKGQLHQKQATSRVGRNVFGNN